MNLARFPQQLRPASAGTHDEFRQLLERFFQSNESSDESSVVTSQWAPRVDIREDSHRFVIFADLPGIDPANVEIWMDRGILSIKGERKSEINENNERYSRIERRYGSFHRRFALPDSADPEGITAQGNHGVLEISIPKRPETTPRRIHVGGGTQARMESDGQEGEGTRQ